MLLVVCMQSKLGILHTLIVLSLYKPVKYESARHYCQEHEWSNCYNYCAVYKTIEKQNWYIDWEKCCLLTIVNSVQTKLFIITTDQNTCILLYICNITASH